MTRRKDIGSSGRRQAAAVLLVAAIVGQAEQASAQRSDAVSDGLDARIDAIYATPNQLTPSPYYENLFATTPGVDRQISSPRFSFNILVPAWFNSNPNAVNSGAVPALETSPVIQLGFATPVFDLPFRFSASASAEVDRFSYSQDADFDKLRFNARLQYVDPNNDQAYSPFVSYVPRMDFQPFFAREFTTRQDLNFGINKVFNFNRDFKRVAFSADSSADTAYSFGISVVGQRRFRTPEPQSTALIVTPSFSYIFNDMWNFSLAVPITHRWFDRTLGISEEDTTVEPIAVIEFVFPSEWFGGREMATKIGRPALDLQIAYEKNWSTVPGFSFDAWYIGPVLKLGWRF